MIGKVRRCSSAQHPEKPLSFLVETPPSAEPTIIAWRPNQRVLRRFALPSLTVGLARTTFLKYAVPNPYSPPKVQTFWRTPGVKRHAGRTPPVRRHATPVLPNGPRVTACAFPGTDWTGSRPAGRHANTGQSILPVSPFVVVSCPAPPVSTPAAPSLPCKESVRPPSRLLLGPHSRTMRGFNHLTDQIRHRGPARLPQSFPR
jgi:hypothetical protein